MQNAAATPRSPLSVAERGVRSYDAAFQARSAGDFPDGATRIDRHDAVEDSEVVFDVLGDDMVIGLGCQVSAPAIQADQMDGGEILVMERETVQGRGRRPCKSNLSALRGQSRPGMEKMLTSVIACLVAVGGRVHATSQPYDHPHGARPRGYGRFHHYRLLRHG
jgi:hypothetical protein